MWNSAESARCQQRGQGPGSGDIVQSQGNHQVIGGRLIAGIRVASSIIRAGVPRTFQLLAGASFGPPQLSAQTFLDHRQLVLEPGQQRVLAGSVKRTRR